MKKFVKAVIKNFQSHKDTTVFFGDITVILGPSDSGKSAFMRAIKWCLYNDPSGIDFLRRGEKWVEVTIYFDDNTIITRHKGDKDFYELTYDDGQVLHLEGFGVGAVNEVVKLHGMLEVDFLEDSKTLNICEQLSAPFFITETPSRRAEIVGVIAKTDLIDDAIQDTNAEIKETKATEKRLRADIKDRLAKLEQYIDLPQMEYDLKDVRSILSDIELRTKIIDKIKTTHASLSRLLDEKNKAESIIVAEEDVNKALELLNDTIPMMQEVKKIQSSNDLLMKSLEKKGSLEKMINQAPIEEINSCIDDINDTLGKSRSAAGFRTCQNKLFSQLERLDKANTLRNGEQEIGDIIEQLTVCQLRLTDIINLKAKKENIIHNITRKMNGTRVISKLETDYDGSMQNYKNKLLEDPQCPFCLSEINKEKIGGIKDII